MKDNFLLKKSQQEVFNKLSDAEAGKLIKGIFQYANTGSNDLDGYLNIIFIPIKNEIDKNEEKYKKICERNRKNGLLGGRPIEEEKNPVGYLGTQKNPKNPIYHNHNHIHNHISQSNINNLEEIGYGEEKPLLVTVEPSSLVEITKKVLEHLNQKTGANFRSSSKATQAKVNARLNEGYKFDDFIVVIDKKCNEWIGTEFEQYLCPETLFGTKFEKYLNQPVKGNRKKTLKDISMSDLDRAIEIERQRSRKI